MLRLSSNPNMRGDWAPRELAQAGCSQPEVKELHFPWKQTEEFPKQGNR